MSENYSRCLLDHDRRTSGKCPGRDGSTNGCDSAGACRADRRRAVDSNDWDDLRTANNGGITARLHAVSYRSRFHSHVGRSVGPLR